MSTRPKRQPRPVRIPVMPELHRLFAAQLHVSMAALRVAPHTDHFDCIGYCLNVLGTAIEGRGEKFAAEAACISAGARAMNQIAAKVAAISQGAALKLHEHELRPIELAVSAADALVPRLSLTEIHEARLRVRMTLAREQAEREQAQA